MTLLINVCYQCLRFWHQVKNSKQFKTEHRAYIYTVLYIKPHRRRCAYHTESLRFILHSFSFHKPTTIFPRQCELHAHCTDCTAPNRNWRRIIAQRSIVVRFHSVEWSAGVWGGLEMPVRMFHYCITRACRCCAFKLRS